MRSRLLPLVTVLCLPLQGWAQTSAPIQSAARPFDLDIVGEVQIGGSDSASADFMANVLPTLQAFVNQNLNEQQAAESLSAIFLDPSSLTLANDATLRAYFISEGAGYHNSLGFSTLPSAPIGSDASLIFPDASSSTGFGGNPEDYRTSSAPLVPGDFVDLGDFLAGTALNFFLIANGANGGTNTWSTTESANIDGMLHAVSLAPDGSAYLVIGFEDLYGGGDMDYNDLVLAIEI